MTTPSGKPAASNIDLTATEPDHVDGSFGPSWERSSDGIVIQLRLQSIFSLFAVIGAAWFLHHEMGVQPMYAVLLAAVVYLVVTCPAKAAKYLLKKVTKLFP